MNDLKDIRMKGFKKRTHFPKVFDVIKEHVPCAVTESISIDDCIFRVLAQDINSCADVPPFNRSAVDGYALKAEDTYGASQYNPAELKIIGECAAGEHQRTIKKTEALRIMTGSIIPKGADACVMVEYCEEKDNHVLVSKPVAGGGNICMQGEDIKKGALVFCKGTRISPYAAGILASIGHTKVNVYRKPKVAIIVTGDELVVSKPKEGQIIDSNTYTLSALVRDCRAEVISKKRVKDDYNEIREELLSSDADIIIITGATSCGKKDYVPLVVNECGKLHLHGVAMKPASPFGIGTIERKIVFLLPGNPVAACVAFDFFVRFALEQMQDISASEKTTVQGILTEKIASSVGRTDIFRVKYDDGKIEPVRVGGSGILSSMIRANAYLVVPQNIDGYQQGTKVDVRLF